MRYMPFLLEEVDVKGETDLTTALGARPTDLGIRNMRQF
jgi:hypothetical protein